MAQPAPSPPAGLGTVLLAVPRRFLRSSTGRLLLLCALIGVIAGTGALVFDVMTQLGRLGFLDGLVGYRPQGPAGEVERFEPFATPFRPALLPLVAGLGGLLAGFVVFRFAPEARGHGTDAAIHAYHTRRGIIRARVPLVKMIASSLTLGTGGSGGREGPIAQIGAGFGSWLATRLGLRAAERRILLAAGIGAGVGSIFRAPLAGAMFAAEILYGEPEFESTVIIPAAISSIVGYCVFSFYVGTAPLFASAPFRFQDPRELLAYAVLAVGLAAVGWLYVRSFYGLERLFDRLPLPRMLRPALGACLAGLVALGLHVLVKDDRVFAVMGLGYGVLQEALRGDDLTAGSGGRGLVLVLILVSLGKILTTGLTIGSGGSAGVFGPSMVIGGAAGGAFGIVAHRLWPHVVLAPGAYVLVGMAGFFAGVAKTPISTVIMVSELTGSYGLLVPTLWVCAICFLLTRGVSIYRSQVPDRFRSPAHQGDFRVDLLEGVRVEHLLGRERRVRTFHEGTSLEEVLSAVSDSRQEYFPVVRDGDEYAGGFTIHTLRQVILSGADLAPILVAKDLVHGGVPSVGPGDGAGEALERLAATDVDEIPVLGTEGGVTRFLGLIGRRDVLLAVHQRSGRRE